MQKLGVVALFLLFTSGSLLGQTVQVSQTNKTIAVTADDSVSVEADVAILTVGYHNYGLAERETYNNNVTVATRVVNALLKAGIPESAIRTNQLTEDYVQPEADWTPEDKRQRKFEAQQSWQITVPAKQAQKIVDLAMGSGANKLQNVSWQYSNLPELQAKAGGVALAKARMVAEQMAKGLNAKIGDLVYASNTAPILGDYSAWRGTASMTVNTSVMSQVVKSVNVPDLKLFPEKVRQSATVHAVFAIE